MSIKTDRDLVQIVDAAMAEAIRKSGPWLACRPGCYQCCLGPFPINRLDAIRLRRGLADLETQDPARAERVRQRALAAIERMRREYPVATPAAVLAREGEAGDEPCPALDPLSGFCDLYEARPVTCRTFGPAVRLGAEEGPIGTCELCYRGASDEEIAACEVIVDPANLESELLSALAEKDGEGETIVAFALAGISDSPCSVSPVVPF
ncbi:MAG: YkgJ family cysteine cluster protein [Acidobacteriia bacterium]|nr:YkgJ family cysteine cluster protein [Terriglobia bacterium]